MRCAVAAATGDALLLRGTPGGYPLRSRIKINSLRPPGRKLRATVDGADASARKGSTSTSTSSTSSASSTSSSSSSQYLDALQSLLREAREDGMPVSEGARVEQTTEKSEGEEAPWSLSDSVAFLSAALGAPPRPPSSTTGPDDDDDDDEEEEEEGLEPPFSAREARELLLKTGWRRSRDGGRYQAKEKAKRAEVEGEEAEGEREEEGEEEEEATTAVPSPSSLSATLSALREHAGLGSPSFSSSLARSIRRCPSLLALSPNQIALAAAFLRSLGLDASDVAAACSREPRLLGFGVAESMAPVASFLRSRRVGMGAEDVARLAVSAPTVLGLSVERSLEPRVAFLERALSSDTNSSSTTNNPLLAKALRSSPSLLHLSLKTGEETLAELSRRIPDAAIRSRAIAAAPSMLLVGAEKVAATLDALVRITSFEETDDDGNEEKSGNEKNDSEKGVENDAEAQKLELASDLVRRHPALLRHAFTGPEAVMLPAADWLARLLSVEAGTEETKETEAKETGSETETEQQQQQQQQNPRPPLRDLPPSSTPRGRALASAAIRRCPALLGRSLSGLEGTASWLEERARVFLLSLPSSCSSFESNNSDDDDDDDGAPEEEEEESKDRNGTKGGAAAKTTTTPLLLVAGVARRFPQCFGLALANLDGKLRFLTDEIGMSEGEAAGVAVSKMPQVLGLRLRSLRARAAFLMDGNEEEEVEEKERDEEEEEEEEGDGSEDGRRRKPEIKTEEEEEEEEEEPQPIRGRRSASEIARFSPALATSLDRLVARHAAAEAWRRGKAAEDRRSKEEEKEEKEKKGKRKSKNRSKEKKRKERRFPPLSSLLACSDAVLERRLGLEAGSLEALKGTRRVREAVERAERSAAAL